ncbi:MAG: DNA polymerase III subunit delta' [Proteobacteria bacterium]|nr:DNA polymerase III subunit delta' [Pseudomonadota bacterium]
MHTQNVSVEHLQCFPWQVGQWRQLVSQFRQQRLGHAFLLCGSPGLGKYSFAEKFAQFLLCKQPDQYACGNCSGCHLWAANNHPDLLRITPEESGKNIKIDQVRAMVDFISKTAQRTGYKIVIIAPAEALNKAAANALLKSLEEPSGKVIFFLISHQPGILPATILSRCQRLNFLADAESALWLSEQLKESAQLDAHLLLKISEYAPLQALALVNSRYLDLRNQLLQHLLGVAQGTASLLTPVAGFLKQDLLKWTEAFISLLTDLLRLKLQADKTWLVNQDCLPDLQKISQHCNFYSLLELLTKLISARQWLLNAQIHLNNQLLVESLLIYFQQAVSS